MKLLRFIVLSSLVLLLATSAVFSQGSNQNGFNPDSLSLVTLTGTAILDSTNYHPTYYLDEDGDGAADYHLNFGPWWYQPDSSAAARPVDGDVITITGGMADSAHYSIIDSLPVVIIYEINGEFWRDPYAPLWGHFGQNRFHNNPNGGFIFGWRDDSLVVVEKTGLVQIDTTCTFSHYYMDEDGDTIPDYFLNFGPPWYEPVDSTLEYPQEGETITVLGAYVERDLLPMIVVFELNGSVWLDSSSFNRQLGGQWIHKNMNQNRFIHTPFDSGNGFSVSPGWHNGMGPGHMQDSLFCQMMQLFPQNVMNGQNENILAGYEVGVFSRNKNNLMMQNQLVGGTMQFAQNLHYYFHYNDIQLQGNGIDESTIVVKTWDPDLNEWQVVDDAVVDMTTNTVSFENTTVSGLIILTGDPTVTTVDEETVTPVGFSLGQNYPNPFNPVTTISFTIAEAANIELNIYNVLGQKIENIMRKSLETGEYSIQYNGAHLPSGVYFYELKTGDNTLVKKMTLLK